MSSSGRACADILLANPWRGHLFDRSVRGSNRASLPSSLTAACRSVPSLTCGERSCREGVGSLSDISAYPALAGSSTSTPTCAVSCSPGWRSLSANTRVALQPAQGHHEDEDGWPGGCKAFHAPRQKPAAASFTPREPAHGLVFHASDAALVAAVACSLSSSTGSTSWHEKRAVYLLECSWQAGDET